MENSVCSPPNSNKMFATKFCKWHDSSVVMPCAKVCCDLMIRYWITAKWNFHGILIVIEKKSLVKCVQGRNGCHLYYVTLNVLCNEIFYNFIGNLFRDHFVYAPSQWETMLHCNVVSHWQSTYTKWSLPFTYFPLPTHYTICTEVPSIHVGLLFSLLSFSYVLRTNTRSTVNLFFSQLSFICAMFVTFEPREQTYLKANREENIVCQGHFVFKSLVWKMCNDCVCMVYK